MTIDTSTTSLRDITLSFSDLAPSKIDISKLKTLFDIQPAIIQAQDASIVIYPPLQLIIQLGQNRIRITHQQLSDRIDVIPLWDIASTCRKLASKQTLSAYGLNYNVVIPADSEAMRSVIKHRFVAEPKVMDELLDGEMLFFAPRIKFKRDAALYDFILEEETAGAIRSHLNVHFETKQLPSKAVLKKQFINEYEEFRQLLNRMFSQD